jgi:hypothetical protein
MPGAIDVAGFDDDYVLRSGLIFRFGEYPDKGFRLSADDYQAAHDGDFAPVPIDLSHTDTVLDGKMGELVAAEVRGDELHGTVRLRRWLDDAIGDAGRKVSCEWDRATNRLRKLSLVPNPRVTDAALFASFSAAHPEAAEREPEAVTRAIASFATPRKRDENLSRSMQSIHDHIKMNHPWACDPAMMSGGDGDARFGDRPKQYKAIHALHRATVEHGAVCSGRAMMSDNPSTDTRSKTMPELTKKQSLLSRIFFGSSEAPAEFAATIDDRTAGHFLAKLGEDNQADKDDRPETPAVKFSDTDEYREMKARLDAAEKAQREAADRNATFAAQLEAARKERIESDAAKFAENEVREGRATPAEFDDYRADYIEAAEADHATGGTVQFADATGASVAGTRVDRLKARAARRPAHGLFAPAIGVGELPAGSTILFNRGAAADQNDPAVIRAETDRALAKFPDGQAILNKRAAR